MKPRPSHNAIIALAAEGATNQQIADHFGITVRTFDRDRAKHPALNDGIKAVRAEYYAALLLPCGTYAAYRRGCRCWACLDANADRGRETYRRTHPLADSSRGRPSQPRIGVPRPRPVSRDVQVEQAFARGLTVRSVMDQFGIDYEMAKTIRDELLVGAE